MLHFLIFPAHAVGDLLVLWPVNQLMSFRKEGGGTMNLASEKVWKKKERVCGMRGGQQRKKERKEGMLFKKDLYTCRLLSGPKIIGILTTLPATAFQCDRATRKFFGQGLSPLRRCWK
jgi:hypothetical protein